jgi:hypothetical protein
MSIPDSISLPSSEDVTEISDSTLDQLSDGEDIINVFDNVIASTIEKTRKANKNKKNKKKR